MSLRNLLLSCFEINMIFDSSFEHKFISFVLIFVFCSLCQSILLRRQEQIRIVRDRHQDHKEFVEWCNGVLADIDRFESELNECNGKLCRNLVKLKAVLRWRSAKKELKEVHRWAYRIV